MSSKSDTIEVSSDSSSASSDEWKKYFPPHYYNLQWMGSEGPSSPVPSTPSSFEYNSSDDEGSFWPQSMTYYQGSWEITPPDFPITAELTREMEKAVASFYEVPVPRPSQPFPSSLPRTRQPLHGSSHPIPPRRSGQPLPVVLGLATPSLYEDIGGKEVRKVMPDYVGKGKGKVE